MSDEPEFTMRHHIVGWTIIISFACTVFAAAWAAFAGVMQWEEAWRWSAGIAAGYGVIFAGALIAGFVVFAEPT